MNIKIEKVQTSLGLAIIKGFNICREGGEVGIAVLWTFELEILQFWSPLCILRKLDNQNCNEKLKHFHL